MNDRVRVYWNIRRNQFSVQQREPKGWRVSKHLGMHMFWYELKDVTFHVSEAGRQRVLSSNRKNVHAWVEGEWVREYALPPVDAVKLHRVRYNPFLEDSFNILGTNIKQAPKIFFNADYGKPHIYVE